MSTENKSASVAIKQAQLFQKVSEICAVVNTVVNASQLLEISLKLTMELFQAKRGSIFILKKNNRDLVLTTSQGMKRDETKRMVKRMGEGIVGKIAQLKQPVFVENIANDRRFKNFKSRSSYRTPSFICAPLMIKDSLMGVINIADKSSGKRFTEDEMQLLDFLTSQIALNYRRIHLYEKYRTAVKESKELKVKLGQTDKEKYQLQRQVVVQEKLASIGKLAGGIAHEFNNPLDGVMRYTNLCLEHLKEDEVVRNYLLEIKHGLNRMATIVKNLLACSRNEFPQRQIVDIKSALEHTISLKRMELTHKNIAVIKNIDEEIPNIPDFGLERIFTNLFQNAIDAISYGGKITVDAKCQDNALVISISDTGIGIPEDSIEKIFEPFYTTKDIGKGCGLGLTVVGEIVKSYNGKIDVSSKKGKGTSFNVTIPLE